MVRKILILILLFGFTVDILGQTPNVLWRQTYGSTNEDESCADMAPAPDGGYALLYDKQYTPGGDHQVHVLKVDATGHPEWCESYGTPNDDHGMAICSNPDGGFVVVGYTLTPGTFSYDVYAVKIDNQGNVLWAQTYGGHHTETGTAVQPTADGGYIIGVRAYYDDFGLIKIDSMGNLQWQRSYFATDTDVCESVQQTSDGGYILAGYTYSIGGGASAVVLVLKTDSLGNLEWYQAYGWGGGGDRCNSVRQTIDGGYILGCWYLDYSNPFLIDYWLIKLGVSGELQWQQRYGGHDDARCQALCWTADGGYLMAGTTASFGAGGLDFYAIKTNGQGIVDWYYYIGGPEHDVCIACLQDEHGRYILAGYTESVTGDYDVCIICLEDPGQPLPDQNPVTSNLIISPNPFNPTTVLSYQLQDASQVNLTVYETAGRLVAELVNGHREVGVHEVTFNGSGLSSGIYIYRLTADNQTVTGKMVLMK